MRFKKNLKRQKHVLCIHIFPKASLLTKFYCSQEKEMRRQIQKEKKVIDLRFQRISEHKGSRKQEISNNRARTCLSMFEMSVFEFYRKFIECQFHQHFTSIFLYTAVLWRFYVLTILGLEFFDKRKLAQKLLVKCWFNWLQKEAF